MKNPPFRRTQRLAAGFLFVFVIWEAQLLSMHDHLFFGGTLPGGEDASRIPAGTPATTSNRGKFCVPWSQNMDSWWTHNPEWTVVDETSDQFCFQKRENTTRNNNRADFLRKLHHLQWNGDCNVVHTRYIWNYGIGYEMNNLAKGFVFGLDQNRPFQVTLDPTRPEWRYAVRADASDPVCPTKDIFCFFLPFSGCSATQLNVSEGWKKFVPLDDTRLWITELILRPQQWLRHLLYEYRKASAPTLGKIPRPQGRCNCRRKV